MLKYVIILSNSQYYLTHFKNLQLELLPIKVFKKKGMIERKRIHRRIWIVMWNRFQLFCYHFLCENIFTKKNSSYESTYLDFFREIIIWVCVFKILTPNFCHRKKLSISLHFAKEKNCEINANHFWWRFNLNEKLRQIRDR